MKPRSHSAFTLKEVLVLIVIVAVIAFFLLPAFYTPRTPAPRIACVNNLKQVGLAFRVWAADHSDQFPMEISTNAGGTRELASGPNAFVHFLAISNELSTPKILLCPADSKRKSAANFAELWNDNISYFVGLDALMTNAQMLLSGDRNITNGWRIKKGVLELTTNQTSGWTPELHVGQGNIGLSDGSVQQVTSSRLREAIKQTGLATNRLAIP
jgi:competence protein ComGC